MRRAILVMRKSIRVSVDVGESVQRRRNQTASSRCYFVTYAPGKKWTNNARGRNKEGTVARVRSSGAPIQPVLVVSLPTTSVSADRGLVSVTERSQDSLVPLISLLKWGAAALCWQFGSSPLLKVLAIQKAYQLQIKIPPK